MKKLYPGFPKITWLETFSMQYSVPLRVIVLLQLEYVRVVVMHDTTESAQVKGVQVVEKVVFKTS